MAHVTSSSQFIPPPTPHPRGGTFAVEIRLENPQLLAELAGMGEDFREHFQTLFSGFIFEVHKHLIRITPIDTGQLRGGWTAWLDKHNVDYTRQLFDISIAVKAPGRDYHFTPAAVEEGKTYSSFESPNPLDVTIINTVPYGIFLEVGTSRLQARNFVEETRLKAEAWMERLFDAWFKKIAAAGRIVPPDEPEEINA